MAKPLPLGRVAGGRGGACGPRRSLHAAPEGQKARARIRLWSIGLAAIPDVALAHGEEVLLFPLGTLVAIAVIAVVALALRIHWHVRVLAGLAAVAASFPLWFVPGRLLPAPLRYTDAGIFATGFLPSLIVAAVVVWLLRRRKSPTNPR